jgi:DNA invertase Pin-like site-specific DNA recombinase
MTNISAYAEERGYNILRWYKDEGISGDATEKRLDFKQLLADAKAGEFEAILVWDQSRFGRFTPQEAIYHTYPLTQAGIQLVTTDKGPIAWDTFVGALTYFVEQHGKHEYLVNLSRDVTRGHLEAMKKASWNGTPPYAYRIEGPRYARRLVLGDAIQVRVVQRIYREFVQDGRSLRNIAERLGAEGYPSPGGRGRRWKGDVVRYILANPAYAGDYAGGRYANGKYHRVEKGTVHAVAGARRGKLRRRAEAEWIVHRDTHEPIVDRGLWEEAQLRLAAIGEGKSTFTHYTPETNPYLLAGILRCGRCGSPMSGISQRGNRFYECRNRQFNGRSACVGTTVREDMVLQSISAFIDTEFLIGNNWLVDEAEMGRLTPERLPKAFETLRALVEPPKEPAVDRPRLERESRELAGRIDKARRNLAMVDADNIPAVQDEIRRMQAEKEQLDAELSKRRPTEDDINAVTLEVLIGLLNLRRWLRAGGDGDEADEFLLGPGVARQECQSALQRLAGIVVHTTISGGGKRTRHRFERGEIAFRPVGETPGRYHAFVRRYLAHLCGAGPDAL